VRRVLQQGEPERVGDERTHNPIVAPRCGGRGASCPAYPGVIEGRKHVSEPDREAHMEFFTVRNTVLVALAQVGVIVAGVLGAGACHKWFTTFNLRPPPVTTLLADYGYVALLLPLAWVGAALWLPRRSDEPEDARRLALFCGILLLLLLLLAVGYAAVSPFFRLIGSFD
jgi:hypothetical protein